VGSFPANPWGLFDMLGNVRQWTDDCSHFSHGTDKGAPRDGSDEGGCRQRVVRGTSFRGLQQTLRVAYRWGEPVSRADSETGFRVAWSE
jgi:formylglycine-generating enzyme required for sulfatase activity